METVSKAFAKWKIPLIENKDYVEYLQENYPEKVFFMDEYPFATNEKYNQIELLYDELLNDKKSYKKYIISEDKYVKALSILWLYNNVWASSNICSSLSSKKQRKIERITKKNLEQLKSNFNKSNNLELENLQDLELLVRLGKRDIAFSEFYLESYEMLIIPSWSCFVLFFNDLSKVEMIEKILNVSGLFLRSYDSTFTNS